MSVRTVHSLRVSRGIAKVLLSSLLGWMGSSMTSFAQQPAKTAVTPAPVSDATPAVIATPAAAPEATVAPVPAAGATPDAAPAVIAAPPTVPEATPEVAPATVATADDANPVATPVAASVKGRKVNVKAAKKKKEKGPKLTPVNIVQGTLTVDGWTGKARMNYDIADLKYVYLWAPDVGTVVVSNQKFPLGKEEPNAFSGNTLTVDANGHTVQLFSEKKLLKDKKPASAWVYVDTMFKMPSTFPVMGYGATIEPPYAWPGAKLVQVKAGIAPPPPLPVNLRPALVKAPCVPVGSKTAGIPCPVATATGSPSGAAPTASLAPPAQIQ